MSFAASSLARRCALRAGGVLQRSSLASPLGTTAAAASSANHLSHPATRSTAAATPTTIAFRYFSDGSHSDFAPQRKAVDDDSDEALKMIDQHVKDHDIMLYMKGSPNMPMCGFSARTVQCLKSVGVDFSSVNVLDYPSIREGVKKYSDWPTIPQLYVKGEFVGGCDIVVREW